MKTCKRLKRVNIVVETEVYNMFKLIVKREGRSASAAIRGLMEYYITNVVGRGLTLKLPFKRDGWKGGCGTVIQEDKK